MRKKTKKTKALAYRENLFILFDGLAWRGLRFCFVLAFALSRLFSFPSSSLQKLYRTY